MCLNACVVCVWSGLLLQPFEIRSNHFGCRCIHRTVRQSRRWWWCRCHRSPGPPWQRAMTSAVVRRAGGSHLSSKALVSANITRLYLRQLPPAIKKIYFCHVFSNKMLYIYRYILISHTFRRNLQMQIDKV